LKPNAGSENKLQYQQAKIEKIFWIQSYSIANTEGARSFKEETKQKGIRKMHRRVFLFQNEKSP